MRVFGYFLLPNKDANILEKIIDIGNLIEISTLTDSEDGDLYHHQHIFRANHEKEFCRGETERHGEEKLAKKSHIS